MYLSDVRQFAALHPGLVVRGVKAVEVQAWVDGLTDISPATIRRKLSAIRNYWTYLQSKGIAPADKPFHALRIRRENPVERAEKQRRAFTANQVRALWLRAESTDQKDLATVIKIAAYTGARLASICTLRASSIRTDEESGIRTLHFADKSGAGVRDVPVHAKISALIDQLIDGKDSSEFLIGKAGKNKHGRRSNICSGDFADLCDEMNYSSHYVFHSIRQTFGSLMKGAGVSEAIAAEIMGTPIRILPSGYTGGGRPWLSWRRR